MQVDCSSVAADDLTAGNAVRAQANLGRALPDLHDPLLLARARQLEATISFIDSRTGADRPGRVGEIASMMLDAARAFEPLDIHRARDAVFDALQMAILFGDASEVSAVEVARVTRSFRLPAGRALAAADLVIDAIAELIAKDYSSAGSLLRQALAAVQRDPEIRRVPRHLARACWIAFALSDDDTLGALGAAVVSRPAASTALSECFLKHSTTSAFESYGLVRSTSPRSSSPK